MDELAKTTLKQINDRQYHMEDFPVKKNIVSVIYDIEQCDSQAAQKRFMAYYKKIYQSVA